MTCSSLIFRRECGLPVTTQERKVPTAVDLTEHRSRAKADMLIRARRIMRTRSFYGCSRENRMTGRCQQRHIAPHACARRFVHRRLCNRLQRRQLKSLNTPFIHTFLHIIILSYKADSSTKTTAKLSFLFGSTHVRRMPQEGRRNPRMENRPVGSIS